MTLDTEIKKAYSEVYEILKLVDKEYFYKYFGND
mgnify:CR=1 FL=1